MKQVKESMFKYTVVREGCGEIGKVMHHVSRNFALSVLACEQFAGGTEHKLRTMESNAHTSRIPQTQECREAKAFVFVEVTK